MRLGHLLGQILPIVQNASAAPTVTGGFACFPRSRSPGVKNWTPGIPGSSREFPLPGVPIFSPWPTIVLHRTTLDAPDRVVLHIQVVGFFQVLPVHETGAPINRRVTALVLHLHVPFCESTSVQAL